MGRSDCWATLAIFAWYYGKASSPSPGKPNLVRSPNRFALDSGLNNLSPPGCDPGCWSEPGNHSPPADRSSGLRANRICSSLMPIQLYFRGPIRSDASSRRVRRQPRGRMYVTAEIGWSSGVTGEPRSAKSSAWRPTGPRSSWPNPTPGVDHPPEPSCGGSPVRKSDSPSDPGRGWRLAGSSLPNRRLQMDLGGCRGGLRRRADGVLLRLREAGRLPRPRQRPCQERCKLGLRCARSGSATRPNYWRITATAVKPVCCNTHLDPKMPPVSMRMAKVQKTTLDPSKISGRCGRLKCCLRYEFDTYQELWNAEPCRRWGPRW